VFREAINDGDGTVSSGSHEVARPVAQLTARCPFSSVEPRHSYTWHTGYVCDFLQQLGINPTKRHIVAVIARPHCLSDLTRKGTQ
jgi:hypothetical protein